MAFTNRLIHETSPYLLQHAHNPVDWYPWGDEALQKARQENKPILVSIGYSACHWCHVMEKESFENEEVANIMNQYFINIKIDREERPDLDHIYMDAVQTMTGSGGWPLNVFLTPDAKPFYGGTYFPPQRAYSRSSWTETLQAIITAYTDRKTEIISQAENLTAHLLQANNFGLNAAATDNPFNTENTTAIFQNLMKNADQDEGGFGKAPKFPQTFSIQYLLRYYHFNKDEAALQHACLSLDKMIEGGIYDQLGGGFARYSTDNEWLAPHFEKMLYDNALLLAVLSEAYQLTHNKRYSNIIRQTIGFIEREMRSADNGFYSALDADSEGEEGKFYVWDKKEIETVLGNDAALFCDYYGVSEKGNWDEKNILHVPVKTEIFLANQGIEGNGDFEIKLEAGRQRLLQHRSKRERPLLDDKILLGWNALMNTAYSKAFAATGEERYRQMAVQNMQFLLKKFVDDDSFFHTYKDGVAKHPAFLDDYAFLIQALIHLQEITADAAWLQLAQKITNRVIAGFEEQDGAFFYFTDKSQLDVIIRKKEVYDAATPSGNSVMAGNLFYLSHVFDNNDWKIRANKMMGSLSSLIIRYPGSFGAAANNFLITERGIKELVITGKNFNDIHFDILHNFMPNRILQLSSVPNELFPLLKGKQYSNPALIYLCENYVCNPPVNNLAELVQQLEN